MARRRRGYGRKKIGGRRRSYRGRRRGYAKRSYRGRKRSYGTRKKYVKRYAVPKRVYRGKQYRKSRTVKRTGLRIQSKELVGIVVKPIAPSCVIHNTAGAGGVAAHLSYLLDTARFGQPGGRFQSQRRPYEKQFVLPPQYTKLVNNPINVDTQTIVGPTAVSFPRFNSTIEGTNALYQNTHDCIAGAYDLFQVQPGHLYYQVSPSSGFFGELTQNAAMYDKYTVDAVEVTFKTAVGTDTAGTVTMSIQPNPTELPVLSIAGQMREVCSTSSSVFTDSHLYYKPSKEKHWTQSPITSKNDRVPDRWTDTCNIHISTDAPPHNAQINVDDPSTYPAILGYVYVTYVATFYMKSAHSNANTPYFPILGMDAMMATAPENVVDVNMGVAAAPKNAPIDQIISNMVQDPSTKISAVQEIDLDEEDDVIDDGDDIVLDDVEPVVDPVVVK